MYQEDTGVHFVPVAGYVVRSHVKPVIKNHLPAMKKQNIGQIAMKILHAIVVFLLIVKNGSIVLYARILSICSWIPFRRDNGVDFVVGKSYVKTKVVVIVIKGRLRTIQNQNSGSIRRIPTNLDNVQ
jgi:hypothetical protein